MEPEAHSAGPAGPSSAGAAAPHWRLSGEAAGRAESESAGHAARYAVPASGHILVADVGTPGIRSAGLDLGDARRFGLAAARSGERLLHRVLDADERAAVAVRADRATQLTALFSMKESVIKVLGGMPKGACYRDISLAGEAAASVRPVRLRGEFARWAEDRAARIVAGNLVIADRLVLSWALALSEGGDR